jgi:hypothetical protein
VYQAVGGHGAIASEVLEDVALAGRVKGAGYKIYFTAPLGIVRTRMYHSFRAMWEGWTKNLYPLVGGSGRAVLLEFSRILCWFAAILLPALYLRWIGIPDLVFLILGWVVAGLVFFHSSYALDLYKNRFPVSYIKYLVPAACAYGAILLDSWWKSTRGTVVWKGREYRAKA